MRSFTVRRRLRRIGSEERLRVGIRDEVTDKHGIDHPSTASRTEEYPQERLASSGYVMACGTRGDTQTSWELTSGDKRTSRLAGRLDLLDALPIGWIAAADFSRLVFLDHP